MVQLYFMEFERTHGNPEPGPIDHEWEEYNRPTDEIRTRELTVAKKFSDLIRSESFQPFIGSPSRIMQSDFLPVVRLHRGSYGLYKVEEQVSLHATYSSKATANFGVSVLDDQNKQVLKEYHGLPNFALDDTSRPARHYRDPVLDLLDGSDPKTRTLTVNRIAAYLDCIDKLLNIPDTPRFGW